MRSLLHRLAYPGCDDVCCSIHAERMALNAYDRMAQRRVELLGRSRGGAAATPPSRVSGTLPRPAGPLSSPSAPARPVTAA